MLISDFARVTGLTRDKVRFYVRQGLLRPRTNGKGGRNPYQIFNAEDVQIAEVIRVAQSLGMSLKEIAALNKARREGSATREGSIAVLSKQLALLQVKATELQRMSAYLRAKIDWLASDEQGARPAFRNDSSSFRGNE
jgi:MerR family transcriptional regulator, copper efflux regulator